jgi:hypothetical protein
MNQRKLSAWIAIASFLIPSIGFVILPSSESAVAAVIVKSKRAPFYSEAGRFSIDFPSKPDATNEKMKEGLTIYSFIVANEQGFYQVGYYDVDSLQNAARTEVRKLLDELPSIYLEPLQAKLVNAKNIQIGNNLGKEFNFTISGQSGRGRLYIVKDRVYIATAIDTQSKMSSFLNSFRLR